MRMLVADDSAIVRMSVRQAIKAARPEAHIDECADGDALRRRLLEADYDVVFTDIHMPGMSGPDAVAAVLQLTPERKFFSVFLSTDMSRDVIGVADRVGAFEFLPKPFLPGEVTEVLDAIDRVRRPARVLLVDDSRTVRKVIDRVLQLSIFTLTTDFAEDGPTAVAMAETTPYDVFFIDVHMPGMDGFDTLIALQGSCAAAQFVLMSAENREAVMLRAAGLNVGSFLTKPFLPKDVDLVLYRLFGLKAPQLARIKAATIG